MREPDKYRLVSIIKKKWCKKAHKAQVHLKTEGIKFASPLLTLGATSLSVHTELLQEYFENGSRQGNGTRQGGTRTPQKEEGSQV